jgi:tRNA(Glu) U13 pseudouridine synthase TruD
MHGFFLIIMYTIKQSPEDFIVKEIPLQTFTNGPYIICLLKKRGYTTHLALEIVAKALGTSDIGYAGNKDIQAVTEQYISIGKSSIDRIEGFSHPDISLEFIGTGNKISLGDLLGNKFEIILRDVVSLPKLRPFFVNYFGEQRFSSDNIEVGRSIIKKDFKKAVEIISRTNNKSTALETYIAKKPQDYVGALKTVPTNVLSLYTHAYQSYIWNMSVSEYLLSRDVCTFVEISGMKFAVSNVFSDEVFPLPGFETETVPEVMQKILLQEKISLRDFIIPQLKPISAGGSSRRIFAKAENFSIEKISDDSSSKKNILLRFSLPKGSYATVYIAELFS